ncbi:MAG: glycosyltransferase family 4 protein [Acidobacteriia bacterium]|nr:glycosyltransferase family 4 protein [Terriglobia bacterium]
MKLLIYSHFFAPSIGGVETIVLSLARGLAERRTSSGELEFDVTLVTQTPAGTYDDCALPFRVVRRPGFLQLWRLLRAADVVHLAGPALPPLFLGLLARKPVILEHHGFQAICPNGQLLYEPTQAPCPGHFMAGRHAQCLRCNSAQGPLASFKLWLLTFLRRFLSKRAAANITPVQWLVDLLQLPSAQAIPHGLNTSRIFPERQPSPGPPVIAFQGRLVTTKGIRVLFEAARLLQEQSVSFVLYVIGDGPERRSLESLAGEWQLAPRVRFFGSLPSAELDAVLAQATVVVVPSLGGEVFGLVLAENMLRGLPVVASDLGAFVEVLGGAGVTFRTADAADLARRLALLLHDASAAANIGARARERVLAFLDSNRMIETHARVYRTLSPAGTR